MSLRMNQAWVSAQRTGWRIGLPRKCPPPRLVRRSATREPCEPCEPCEPPALRRRHGYEIASLRLYAGGMHVREAFTHEPSRGFRAVPRFADSALGPPELVIDPIRLVEPHAALSANHRGLRAGRAGRRCLAAAT